MNFNLTLIGQSLAFFLFFWTCAKFVWPPLITAMRERQARIAQGLESAVQAEQNLEQAQQRAGQELETAKEEARKIIEQARGRATQMIEEAKEDARREGERQKAAAQAEIEQEVNRLREALRGQVAALAVAGAERILQSAVDQSKHAELLDKLAAEL